MVLRKYQARILCLFIFFAVFFALTAGVARAEYPDKPITSSFLASRRGERHYAADPVENDVRRA